MQTRENRLAVEIVDTLMTVGDSDEHGTRLVIWNDRLAGEYGNRGGWCRDSAVREVEKILIAKTVQPLTGGRG